MKDATAADAVGFFGSNVEEFDALYGNNPGFQERLAIWDVLFARYLKKGASCLDLGCGAGVFSFRLAELGANVVGLDGSPDMVAFCESERRKRGLENVRFLTGRLPLIDERGLGGADLVISSSVVEYVRELDETFALFARLLRPGGTLIVSMPNVHSISRTYQRVRHRLLPRADVYRYIRHFTSPGALQARVRPLSFSLQEAHYYTHMTRLARAGRDLGLPGRFTADLFVAAFRKNL